MKYSKIRPSFYVDNRSRLISQLADNSLLILYSSEEYPRNGDQFFPFRQNSDLFYLTGIDQENTALLIWKDSQERNNKTMLFIKKADKNQEIWYGKKLNKEKATLISGIDLVYFFDEMDGFISDFSSKANNFYSWQPDFAKFDHSVLACSHNMNALTKSELSHLNQINLFELTSKLRLIKKDEELIQMKKAIQITKDA